MSAGFEFFKSRLAIILASAVCLMTGALEAGHPCKCGREHFGPCTLGPAPYGYYPAQWRRWPTDESTVASAPSNWRPAAPTAPRFAPPPGPAAAGKRSPDQLFEEEIPAIPPRGPVAPPIEPKPMPRGEDPFKDDTTSSPLMPHLPSATPAAAPRAPLTADPDDREASATSPGQFDPLAGRPKSMRTINPLDDDAGLDEPALVENKRSVVPASRTAKPAQLEPALTEPAVSGNPLRGMSSGASRAGRGGNKILDDGLLDPEQEEARLNSANEPQLLPSAKASPLEEYAPAADNKEPAPAAEVETEAPAPADGEPRLIEPAVDAQAVAAPTEAPVTAEAAAPGRWRESDVIRSGFNRPKSFRRPMATASEGASSNPLRNSSSAAANPLR